MNPSADGTPPSPGPQRNTLRSAEITIVRLSSDRDDLPPGPTIAGGDAYSVIVQLQDFASHLLWRAGQLIYSGGHARAALAITDLHQQWRCHHRSPFDNLRFQLTRCSLQSFARELEVRPLSGLKNPQGQCDVVVLGLASALLPALENPSASSRLFVDQVLIALQTHLIQHYGDVYVPEHDSGLARWQEQRAKEFLAENLLLDVSIADVAAQVQLSRSHFSKAFKQTTGRTPHRWLQEYRIDKARQLLQGAMSISDIAAACGFADQSHLTRVFAQIVGLPPSKWRRLRK
jgi:AraC family transcriptional regulator